VKDSTNDQNDSLVNKPKGRGGYRPGSGRKPGKMEEQTIRRMKVLEAYRERVMKDADQLFNAQMSLAVGSILLFRIDKDDKGKDLPAVQVTDPEEIKAYIDGDAEQDAYYYITTKLPDNRAIDSMLDRTFGKAPEKIDVTSNGKTIQSPAIVSTIKPRNADSQTQATAGD
jgi:hypothetical protein